MRLEGWADLDLSRRAFGAPQDEVGIVTAAPRSAARCDSFLLPSLRNHDGNRLEAVGEGFPQRWKLKQLL